MELDTTGFECIYVLIGCYLINAPLTIMQSISL